MSYTHLTKTELIFIEEYFAINLKGREIAKKLKRGHESIRKLKEGKTAIEIFLEYQENKQKCGCKFIQLPQDEMDYINQKIVDGWTPDVIIGRKERPLSCGMKTLYRMFEKGIFNQDKLPMKGKRKPNGHQEKRGKQAFKRSILDRDQEHPNYQEEFGHLEGDTIVGVHHKSAVITLVERISKCIITLKPEGRKACNIQDSLNDWLSTLPMHSFKSIIFDCGKENSNGLLRKGGLPKEMDFCTVTQEYITSVSSRRNNIPRKSLNYQTPIECFTKHAGKEVMSRLI